MPSVIGRGFRGFGRAIRDTWLALGVTLLLFLALEGGYRLWRDRGGPRPPRPTDARAPDHPYAKEPWWAELRRDLELRDNVYDPYRSHWSGVVRSRYVNIDSAGHRLTVQPGPPERATKRLFMLGGSTMWGYTSRDSTSIPSLTGVALASRGVTDVEVVNLGQAAYNTTQELITLELELLQGRTPSVAVFLDGYNDVATAWRFNGIGRTYGDESISQQIELGRREFGQELVGLGLRIAEAVGEERGFKVAYFLQPVHVVSKKPLSDWEKKLDPQVVIAACLGSIDSAMADRRGRSYYSLTDLFDHDSSTAFVDAHAHLTEAANRQVAERIADVVAPWLGRR
jgi:hypothetical protein